MRTMACGGRQCRIMLLTPDAGLAKRLHRAAGDVVACEVFERGSEALDHLFGDPPDLLVVDAHLEDIPAERLLVMIKAENVYRQVPVLLCVPREELVAWSGLQEMEVDDFLCLPLDEVEAGQRMVLAMGRLSRTLDANPLTRLAGNSTIIQYIQELADRSADFGVAYVDIDYFKSFNDRYGFSRGDEVLMMTARVLSSSVQSVGGAPCFVGHVGGDDFVVVMDSGRIEEGVRRIIDHFDAIVPTFYDQEDRDAGGIHSHDRKGVSCFFPLMTLSIGVVFSQAGMLSHYGQFSAVASQLKNLAKQTDKSAYALDRRRT